MLGLGGLHVPGLLVKGQEASFDLSFALYLEDGEAAEGGGAVDEVLVEEEAGALADEGDCVLNVHFSGLGVVDDVVFEVAFVGRLGDDAAVHESG